MNSPGSINLIYIWVPNLFDFKGGIQAYLQDFLKALNTAFPEKKLIVFDKLDRKQCRSEIEFENIRFFYTGHFFGFVRTFCFAVVLFVRAILQQPSLLISGHLNFAPVALLLHGLIGVPYWIIVYGVDAWEVKNPIKRLALRKAAKIISIGDYTRNRLIEEQKLECDLIPLLPVTFDADRFKISSKPEHLLKRYGLTADQPVILTVARLSSSDAYKGYDSIIQSLPKIRQVIPNVHYLLVGKGDDRPRIEQLIQKQKLQSSVTLTGFVADRELCDHYNLCDVFAMPSKGEGFGIVYLEALACGKPTLGGNQDGAIDALCHGELGALVNPDDVDEIATTLIQILQRVYPNPRIYQPNWLRQRVINTFGFEKFQQTLSGLISSALADSTR